MANILKKRESNFTTMSNSFLRDSNISFKAKGLFCYMYSMSNNWNFTIKSIATQQKDGQASIISSMNELKEYGYITYEKHQNGSGTYTLNDEPNLGNPNVGNPNLGKSTRIKKEKLDKNKNSKVHPLLVEYKETTGTDDKNELAFISNFIKYRSEIKKKLNTIAPLETYWATLKTLHDLGYDVNDCIKQMKSNEWQTLRVGYIHKDTNKNKVSSNDEWSK